MTPPTHRFAAISCSRQAALQRLMEDNADCLMIDSYKGAPRNMRPFDCFNPFRVWPEPSIPVPGQDNHLARSVESVWQGLKLVDDIPDFAQFAGQPTKRPPDHARHTDSYRYADSQFLYGERKLGLVSARFLIYLPTYLYLLNTLVPDTVIGTICEHLNQCGPALFFDWDENQDILDPSRSWSHSALLASWFNGTFEKDYLHIVGQALSAQDADAFVQRISGLRTRPRFGHGGAQ